jgi:hypothetical protein
MWTSNVAVLGAVIAIGASATERRIPVCMDTRPDPQVFISTAAVSQIYSEIGVILDWRRDLRSCAAPEKGIVIKLESEVPPALAPHALAYALPYEGRTIVVFLDRIKSRRFRPLLTYVLAHEIAHILQGIARHSEAGILRHHWSSDDYSEMRRGTLAFTPGDVYLIRLGFDVLHSGTASAKAK